MKWSVYKFNPAVDAAPYYITGEVPYEEGMTALHALKWFDENVAHVNFDMGCRARLCGRCAMMLDGEPCVVCTRKIEDADHVVEPLEGHRVVRDLIVDKHPLDERLTALYERVKLEPYTEETLLADRTVYTDEKMWMTYGMEFCSRCGSCNAGCPAKALHPEEYVGPAGMLAIAYRYLDPNDKGDRVMQAVSQGLYHCIMCGKCDEVCAHADIKHLDAWRMLREEAEERGLVPSYAL